MYVMVGVTTAKTEALTVQVPPFLQWPLSERYIFPTIPHSKITMVGNMKRFPISQVSQEKN